MKKIVLISCSVFLLLGLFSNANASLVGDSITLGHYGYDDYISSVTTNVGAGIEYTSYYVSIDVGESSISIGFPHSLTAGQGFITYDTLVGPLIQDLNDDVGSVITGISIDTSITQWIPKVTFTDDSVSVWLNGTPGPFETTDYITVGLTFGDPVPIPSTIFLLGFGLLGLAEVSRRKKQRH